MADSMVSPAKNGSRVMAKILQRIARGSSQTTLANQKSNLNFSRLKRRCWVIADADPAVSMASYAEAPVKVGDWAYRVDTDEPFLCAVAPEATTNASFINVATSS